MKFQLRSMDNEARDIEVPDEEIGPDPVPPHTILDGDRVYILARGLDDKWIYYERFAYRLPKVENP